MKDLLMRTVWDSAVAYMPAQLIAPVLYSTLAGQVTTPAVR